MNRFTFIGVVALSFGCASTPEVRAPRMSLPGTDERHYELPAEPAGSRYTVLIFRSQKCACVSAHTARLRALSAQYSPRGVRFFGVNPEPGLELAEERTNSSELGFPVLIDREARLAKSLGADYAGYTVVIDGSGEVLYRGGIDSDQKTLHADAEPYLQNALDDLLAGRSVRRPESRTLGCALRTW
jgi:hypothetical protein